VTAEPAAEKYDRPGAAATAVLVLLRARRRVREITARKREIERLLAGEAR
jgi:hypothetical protein